MKVLQGVEDIYKPLLLFLTSLKAENCNDSSVHVYFSPGYDESSVPPDVGM